jgi:hypothetical protein
MRTSIADAGENASSTTAHHLFASTVEQAFGVLPVAGIFHGVARFARGLRL